MDLGEPYDYYMQGVTPNIAKLILATHEEGAAVLAKLGVEAGDMVKGLNRAGEVLGEFEATRGIRGNAKNKTYVITVEVPKELVMEVRNIRVGGE